MAKKWDKYQILRTLQKLLFIIGGSFLLAFGDAAFLEPLGLVTGGVISIGIIVQYYVSFPIVDFVTWGLQITLLIVSLFSFRNPFWDSILVHPSLQLTSDEARSMISPSGRRPQLWFCPTSCDVFCFP